MSKFKIKMKLTGFELEIEGSREDVPTIQQALGRQLGGLLQPPSGIIDQEPAREMKTIEEEQSSVLPNGSGATKKRRRKSSANGSAKGTAAAEEAPVNWPRDVTNFGVPTQTWKTAEKALWTLYVAKETAGENELTGKRICDTFNKHYRQAKPILLSNVIRDLGTLKTKTPTWVGEDTTKSPAAWYLTDAGIKEVQKRIAAAQSGSK